MPSQRFGGLGDGDSLVWRCLTAALPWLLWRLLCLPIL